MAEYPNVGTIVGLLLIDVPNLLLLFNIKCGRENTLVLSYVQGVKFTFTACSHSEKRPIRP